MAANLELDPAEALVGAARLAVLAERLSAAAASVHDTAVELAVAPGVVARRDELAGRLGRHAADIAVVAQRARRHAEAVGTHDHQVAEGARRLEAGLAAPRR
ncbi:MAG TPA: hypothetical protein VH008_25010 [Pseudonocardia sp.]|nr:hypothetical protein [Pseudonocardia sp.]